MTRTRRWRPADLVAWLGAVQAQEYPFAKWSLALRLPDGTTDAEIEHAFHEGQILRTHVMRPTWHFVTPADIGWMLELTAGRVHRAVASYNRQHELDSRTLTRATRVFERALAGGQHLTRAELGAQLKRTGLVATGVRLALVTIHAELEGVICSGPRRGKQFTYALLAERAPRPRRLRGDEAVAELTRRYFSSHGPATIRDFVWWSGLTTADATRGLDMIKARQEVVDARTYWSVDDTRAGDPRQRSRTDSRTVDDRTVDDRGLWTDDRGPVHLLPVYDEYLIAYRDRVAVPHGPGKIQVGSRSVTFQNALVSDGQVAGTWRIDRKPDGNVVDVTSLGTLSRSERRALDAAAARYGRFLGVPLGFSIR